MDYRFIRKVDAETLESIFADIEIDSEMSDGHTALTAACASGRVDVIDFLLANGADVNGNSDRGTPLTLGCFEGRMRVVKRLISAGADVNLPAHVGERLSWTPLMAAANDGHDKVIRYLVENGAQLDCIDNAGNTALHHACFCPRKSGCDVAKTLLENGAHPAVANADGKRPYQLAIEKNWLWSPQIVEAIHRAAARRNPDGTIAE